MAQPNRISVIIPQADHDAIMQHLTAIDALLEPYLIDVTETETKTLARMGDKSQPFVEKALGYAQSNPQYVAPSVSVPEWKKDFDAWKDLMPINNRLEQLHNKVDGTVIVLGAESLNPARWIYAGVDLAAERDDQEAKTIYDDLAQRYQRSTYKRKDDNK